MFAKFNCYLFAIAVTSLFAGTASAITFTPGVVIPGGDVVVLTDGLTGNPITGTVSGTTVTFGSTETLVESTSAQALITGLDQNLNAITIQSALNVGYGLVIFDLQGTQTGTATINVTDQLSNTSAFAFSLGNGINFLSIQATGSELITMVDILSNINFSDIRSIRIGGVESFGSVSTVPLPGALPLFATGLGALGLLGWRRKKKAALAA
jgi:hypothetical protein